MAEALKYHSDIMGSEVFKALASAFNQRRQQQGLDPIDVVVPPLDAGDFETDNLQQLELDAIRGYDGLRELDLDPTSKDLDLFGLRLHEFRVAVDLIDGQEALRVTEEGKTVWERVPAADRHVGSPDYVQEVLAFAFDCSAGTVPCNLTGISPATVTTFVHSENPPTFTAEGTGLAKVQWSAPGGTPDTGTGATFTTKWRETGQKTVTAACGGTTLSATVTVLDVSIEINNTPSTSDDIVQLKSLHPPQRFKVPCRIRLIGTATANVNVVLINQDQRLNFPPDIFLKEVELKANGDWTGFEISGEMASKKKGDAKSQVQGPFAGDGIVAETNVTVFSFDQAKISVTQGGKYVLVGKDYRPTNPDVAVSFSAQARLRPEGLDCSAPQIANLRIGIMQERSEFLATATWDTPTIAWVVDASGKTVTVSNARRQEITVEPGGVPLNISSSPPDAPLWDRSPDAEKPPAGCTGAGAAESFDYASRSFSEPTDDAVADDDGTRVGTVKWNWLLQTTLKATFRTFCVVFDARAPESTICALRQAKWTLNVNSKGPPERQQARVSRRDAAASTDPSMPITHTDVMQSKNFGTAKTKFTAP